MMPDAFSRAFAAHLERVEAENSVERFQACPAGTMAALYTAENLGKPIGVPGWSRLWLEYDEEGNVIAHASAYAIDLNEPDMVSGHISVESKHRGKKIAAKLHAMRTAWLDRHGFMMLGPIVPGNVASMRSHIAAGFEFLRIDEETGNTWVCRWPQWQPSSKGAPASSTPELC